MYKQEQHPRSAASQQDVPTLTRKVHRRALALCAGVLALIAAVCWCTLGGAIGYSTESGVNQYGPWYRAGYNSGMPIALGAVVVASIWCFVAWRLLVLAQHKRTSAPGSTNTSVKDQLPENPQRAEPAVASEKTRTGAITALLVYARRCAILLSLVCLFGMGLRIAGSRRIQLEIGRQLVIAGTYLALAGSAVYVQVMSSRSNWLRNRSIPFTLAALVVVGLVGLTLLAKKQYFGPYEWTESCVITTGVFRKYRCQPLPQKVVAVRHCDAFAVLQRFQHLFKQGLQDVYASGSYDPITFKTERSLAPRAYMLIIAALPAISAKATKEETESVVKKYADAEDDNDPYKREARLLQLWAEIQSRYDLPDPGVVSWPFGQVDLSGLAAQARTRP